MEIDELDPLERATVLARHIQTIDAGRKFFRMFPDDGLFARENYPQQIKFFALGEHKPYRCLLGGNGTGKSVCGAFELTCHLTGLYPEWWTGKRYTKHITAWAGGVDYKSLRESLQPTVLGSRGMEGTGMIPRDLLIDFKYRPTPADSLDYILVRHASGGISRLVIKSYEEGRESFQAANVDFIWLDEEPAWPIYSECIQRFRGETAQGQLILTFTPLFGISEVITMFLPTFMQGFNEDEYERSGRAYVTCTMDDVPHITPEEKAVKIANTLPHEREARINGVPSVGEGRVYPFAEDSFVIDPIPGGVPKHYLRLYGLDPGLNCTAAIWGAHDTDSDIIYLYSEHYIENELPPVHAQAIRARGHWIPGVIDPASWQRNTLSMDAPIEVYRKLGLRLKEADNTRDGDGGGIYDVYERLSTGRLKVYKTLTNFLREFRQYSRDRNNRIIKRNDHLLDAARYLVRGIRNAAQYRASEFERSPVMREETFGLYQ